MTTAAVTALGDGWLDPDRALLVLETSAGVRVLDSTGTVLAEFDPSLTEEIKGRLRGGDSSPSALLEALVQHVPPLARMLRHKLTPLTPASLLGERRWGQLFVELSFLSMRVSSRPLMSGNIQSISARSGRSSASICLALPQSAASIVVKPARAR